MSSASARHGRPLGRKVDPTGVACIEDQDDRKHSRKALGQQVLGRNGEGNAGVPDLAFGARAGVSLSVWAPERPGDLLGAQATEGPQDQRDLRLQC
jgi:hypothetical protein